MAFLDKRHIRALALGLLYRKCVERTYPTILALADDMISSSKDIEQKAVLILFRLEIPWTETC